MIKPTNVIVAAKNSNDRTIILIAPFNNTNEWCIQYCIDVGHITDGKNLDIITEVTEEYFAFPETLHALGHGQLIASRNSKDHVTTNLVNHYTDPAIAIDARKNTGVVSDKKSGNND